MRSRRRPSTPMPAETPLARRRALLGCLLLLLTLAAACISKPTATPELLPSATPEPTPDAVLSALFTLVSRHRLDAEDIDLLSWEAVDWPDGCLGVPTDGFCTQAIVPGYRLTVVLNGREFEYRTTRADAQPYLLLLADGPQPALPPGAPGLTWRGGDAGCQHLQLAVDGRASLGPCGAPQEGLDLTDETKRKAQLEAWVAGFRDFRLQSGPTTLAFRGEGFEDAPPAWQRAISAWAALVLQELESGRSGASWGLALAWHQPIPGQTGFCQFLQVDVYGWAYASTARCEGGDAQDLGQGWLTDEELAVLDGWLYGRAPLDNDSLVFSGRGEAEFALEEVTAMAGWGEAVHRRLATQAYP